MPSSNNILHKFAYCTQKGKLHLLESYYLNLYCSELCCDYFMSSISKLRVPYKNVFRNLLDYVRRDCASSMFIINAIDTYEVRMRKSKFTFRQRLLSSSKNNIVTCINTNIWLRHNYMWQKWDNSLYICHNYRMFHIIVTTVCAIVI